MEGVRPMKAILALGVVIAVGAIAVRKNRQNSK